jgi:hypothetical protein
MAKTTGWTCFEALLKYVTRNNLGEVDSREWHADWAEEWVVYGDLIAFGARAKRSPDVILNNIVRFDRASNLARAAYPSVRAYRFSDSTFAVSDSLADALGFAITLQHACLALNTEFIQRPGRAFFIHTIVPRITIAKGDVLLLPDPPPPEPRFFGLDPKAVIAGSGIVKVYELEKRSAGGLISLEYPAELPAIQVRGTGDGVRSGVERWIQQLATLPEPQAGTVFKREKLIDIPWLLFRPGWLTAESLWTASDTEANAAIRAYLKVWELCLREFYSPSGSTAPLDSMKHYCAAVRHAAQCIKCINGQLNPNYWPMSDLEDLIEPA